MAFGEVELSCLLLLFYFLICDMRSISIIGGVGVREVSVSLFFANACIRLSFGCGCLSLSIGFVGLKVLGAKTGSILFF